MNLPSRSVTDCVHVVRDIFVSDVEEDTAYISTFLKLYSSITFIDMYHETQDFLLYFS